MLETNEREKGSYEISGQCIRLDLTWPQANMEQ